MGTRNDESLVTEIQYGDFRLLLTGDVGKEGEEKMREAGLLAPVTVLKAAITDREPPPARSF